MYPGGHIIKHIGKTHRHGSLREVLFTHGFNTLLLAAFWEKETKGRIRRSLLREVLFPHGFNTPWLAAF